MGFLITEEAVKVILERELNGNIKDNIKHKKIKNLAILKFCWERKLKAINNEQICQNMLEIQLFFKAIKNITKYRVIWKGATTKLSSSKTFIGKSIGY